MEYANDNYIHLHENNYELFCTGHFILKNFLFSLTRIVYSTNNSIG